MESADRIDRQDRFLPGEEFVTVGRNGRGIPGGGIRDSGALIAQEDDVGPIHAVGAGAGFGIVGRGSDRPVRVDGQEDQRQCHGARQEETPHGCISSP